MTGSGRPQTAALDIGRTNLELVLADTFEHALRRAVEIETLDTVTDTPKAQVTA
ncbi:hypothetical protein [Microvirga sp. TS319]|uniref:hypothetical protein n=1 Tax=Microvirga sp. TS319 TaxID=3241165 RepID=UPI003519E806